jgi:hypothetical protein
LAAKKKANKKKLHSQNEAKAAPKEAKEKAPLFPSLVEGHEEEEKNPKDEFFDEEELKEFSVKDEEEDTDDADSGEGGVGEPAWDEDSVD